MIKRSNAFVVTHVCAPDPDPRKVKAALEIWQIGLAESVMAGRPLQGEKPAVRVRVRCCHRPSKPEVSGGSENA